MGYILLNLSKNWNDSTVLYSQVWHNIFLLCISAFKRTIFINVIESILNMLTKI